MHTLRIRLLGTELLDVRLGREDGDGTEEWSPDYLGVAMEHGAWGVGEDDGELDDESELRLPDGWADLGGDE
jgi:hypothetical protein